MKAGYDMFSALARTELWGSESVSLYSAISCASVAKRVTVTSRISNCQRITHSQLHKYVVQLYNCICKFTCLQALNIFEKCSNVCSALQNLIVPGKKGLEDIRRLRGLRKA